MLNSNTAVLCRILHPDAQKALLDWFATLSERYERKDGKRVNGRAWRAELKRMAPPYGVMICEGHDALRQALLKHMRLQPLDEMALALFVSVAVHIKSHKANISFAAQLGEKLKGSTSYVSGLRFERLQKASDPETFCQFVDSGSEDSRYGGGECSFTCRWHFPVDGRVATTRKPSAGIP
ncbi:CRISPR-associated protein Cse2 family [Salmonella enterica subsp. enterica]|uniref:CRISPR-associated protein Cse2 family n=1 Tax=Salmonella enterica I TaxID=59201 RepID=A0A3S4FRW2_SALET|nr:CRISPR-associated protein Cse2 family [Salmonella enterica subsp. enterica]